MAWKADEDRRLKAAWGVWDKAQLVKEFKRKWGTIWLRAKQLGLTKKKGTGRKWSVDELEKLYAMTSRMADPQELSKAFPGRPFDELLEEAARVGCDICYLKNREVIRKSVDVVVDVSIIIEKMEVKFK